MSESLAGDEVLECTRCEHRIRENLGRNQFMACPHCGETVAPDLPRRRAPAFKVLALVIAVWAAAVVPQIGKSGSAEVTCIATLVAFTVLAIVHGNWRDTRRSVKLLEGGKRAFGMMLIVSIGFALLSVYIRIGGDNRVANWTLSYLLGLQISLAEWHGQTTLKAVTKWLLLGAAALAMGAALFNQPGALMRLARYRRSLSGLLSLASLLLIAFGSFSIIAASSAAAPVRLTDEKVAETLRETQASLERLETRARIVVGEQLAAAIIEAPPGANNNGSQSQIEREIEGLLSAEDDLSRAEEELDLAKSDLLAASDNDGPPPSAPGPVGQPTSDAIDRIAKAYGQAIRAPRPPVAVAHEAYATLKPVDIIRASRAVETTAQPLREQWSRPAFREAVQLAVEASLEGAGVRIPSIPLPKEFGSFFSKLVDTLTSKRANKALDAAVTDVTVQIVTGESTPRATIKDLARPLAGRLSALRSYLVRSANSVRARAEQTRNTAAAIRDEAAVIRERTKMGLRCRWVQNGVPGPWMDPCPF